MTRAPMGRRWPAALAALFLAGPVAAQGPFPAAVRVATVEMAFLAPTIRIPGTVLSRDDARLAAEVAGNLTTVAEIGIFVEAGEVVASIEDAAVLTQRLENQGVLAREQSRIAFLEREVERLQALAAQNNAARSQLEQTESDLAVARNEVRVARARLQLSEIQLDRTRIKAPFAGRVTERFLNPGERVNVGDEVVRLVNPRRVEVVARAPLSAVDFLRENEQLAVSSERLQGVGTLRAVVPFGDARSHMYELRLDLAAERGWVVGENVKVTVPTAPGEESLAVPRDAIILRSDGAAVFRVTEEQTAERVAVVPGLGDGDYIGVSGDLRAGDTVVIRGGERLRPGMSVSVLNAEDTG